MLREVIMILTSGTVQTLIGLAGMKDGGGASRGSYNQKIDINRMTKLRVEMDIIENINYL
jgi:hypothetical protein